MMVIGALLLAFPAIMAYAAVSDMLTMTIPNWIILALVGFFFIVAVIAGVPPVAIAMHLTAGALVLAVTFALFAFGWIGGGDAKLAAATALWLGFGTLMEYLLIASAAGGALTLAILALRGWSLPVATLAWPWLTRLREPKAGVPYGIALAAAALFVFPHCDLWATALAR